MSRFSAVSCFAVFISLGLVVLGPLFSEVFYPPELPILGEVPYFSLVDENAEAITAEDFRGKVWVANFFFSKCDGPCPMLSRKMAGLALKYANMPTVHFTSISVDPENDTAETLKAYKEKIGAQKFRWHFLTGDKKDIESLISRGFMLGYSDNIRQHTTRFVLIDRKLAIRGFYSTMDEEDEKKLERDLKALTKVRSW